MKVLAIDSTNFVMGISIVEDHTVLGEVITNLKINHSIRVMPAIQKLLEDCGLTPKDLDKIVVANGPGSYTGVRIGVTIAKTLAWSLGIPLVGVSSLEVLSMNGRYFDGLISPIFDARRGQVYTSLYRVVKGNIIRETEDQILLLSDWVQQLKSRDERVLFLGNDLRIHKQAIVDALGEQAVICHPTENNPRPSELAFIGSTLESNDVHSFVPNYVRLAEAEANWLASNKEK
ncbi:tRNA (adenosine(37)-N6)-threonylcarbamoyltransferase complex dimerization subunit type 1 TsaB [Bacillus timonensis]|nr:tRNA (adenosine(37)-N6)-threonylcarbamoyltransferase complex dimerization subunit type 1 TsaB [Bacillus timonensis]